MARGSSLADCKKLPVEKVTAPPTESGYYELLTNRYWQVVDNCILLYRGFAPQCNENRSIVARLTGDVGEVVYLERVWLRHECEREF
jgi:hypothetical protein